MLSSSQRQRANRAHQRRRLWAGALCAASFLAGQAVWGAPPAQLTPPDAPPTPSEVWRQYQVAKGNVSQQGAAPAGALRPATLKEPAAAPANTLLGKPAVAHDQPKRAHAVVQASAMAPVVTPEEVNSLRQAPTSQPAAAPVVSPAQAAPPMIPARPLPLSGKGAEASLPPILTASSLARPQPRPQTSAAEAKPVGEIKPVTETRPVNATSQPRLPFPAPIPQPIAPLAPIVQPARSRAEPMFIAQPAAPAPLPGPVVGELPAGSPFEVIKESGSVSLRVHRSLLMRTKVDIYRTAIVDEAICDVVQFTPREVSLIGRAQGSTHITFWFDDPNTPPLTYVVKVEPDPQVIQQVQQKYQMLEDLVNEMFPDSKIRLVLLADKLLVKGQARDPEEAAQIMTILRAQGAGRGGIANVNGIGGLGGGVGDAAATGVLPAAATGPTNQPVYQLINMLRVPGIQQVALKVKIAELNRTAARGFGVNVRGQIDIGDMTNGTQLVLSTLLNPASSAAILGTIDSEDLTFSIRYLQEHGVARLLSEPTLVTMSGRSATFVAGGEFAVPTIVGSVGLNAVTTDFRAFGAVISFMPTVIDKDHIRLQVSPEFSQINTGLSVGGTPGLNVRSATTTVEMREGQTLAIAGLIEDNYKATQVGDFPFLARVFGKRDSSRNETELIILVTPELMHPMEPEEVPPLPGFDVTEPNAGEFFLHGQLEGVPTRTHRTTVWPQLKKRYGAGGPAMTSGPFGHGQ